MNTSSSTRTRPVLPRPARGQVRVKVAAIGMSTLGLQVAAIVEAVGPEAGGFAPGDRVLYRATDATRGGRPTLPERDLIGFPKDVPLETAAAFLQLGLLSRTIVKQQHPVGRGNRVFVAEHESGADEFVRAWIAEMGAFVVDEASQADVVITASDYEAARRWRYGAGISQQAAADVFQAVRRGVFAALPVASFPLSDAEQAKAEVASGHGPCVLLPIAA